jgi:FkbM family methyltransferase
MLLTTNAHIIAFEPNPSNLFCFTSTLLQLPASYVSRVTLFPIGVGDMQSNFQIFAAKGNMGNSVIGGAVKDNPEQVFLQPESIIVERFDHVMRSDLSISLRLVKIDAQGFECNILRGMGTGLAAKIKTLVTEVAMRWLAQQGCSEDMFFAIAQQTGFVIISDNAQGIRAVLDQPVKHFSPNPNRNDYDVVLVPRNNIETKSLIQSLVNKPAGRGQSIIVCLHMKIL